MRIAEQTEKMRVLLIANREDEVKITRKLFENSKLRKMYDFLTGENCEDIVFPFRQEIEKIDRNIQKERIKNFIIEKINDFDLLVMDMLLTDKTNEDPPVSLEIVDEMNEMLANKEIVFVTGFTSNKGLLTGNDKWKSGRYKLKSWPDFRNLNEYVSECDELLWPQCKKENRDPDKCKKTDCFIEFFYQLYCNKFGNKGEKV